MKSLLVFPAVILSALPLAAQAASCPAAPYPQVVVNISQEEPQLVTNRNINELKVLSQSDGAADTMSDGLHVPLGLAVANAQYTVNIKAQIATFNNSKACAALSEVVIDLSFANNVIYVASDLPRGSCIFNNVHAHERQHVAVDHALLQDFSQKIRYQTSQEAGRIGNITAPTSQAAFDKLSDLLKPSLDRAMQDFMAERARRQARVDSPQEYDRVSRSCNGEAQRYIRQSLDR